MQVIKPTILFIDKVDANAIMKKLEYMGRKCYQSESKDTPTGVFLKNIIKSGHTSVLEHAALSFAYIADRGVLNQLVRHRIASYSQESTRYCNYMNGKKFDSGVQYIYPIECEDLSLDAFIRDKMYKAWYKTCEHSSEDYGDLMEIFSKPDFSRCALNLSTKSDAGFTMNIRSLRNFFELRCDKHAHAHMKELAIPHLIVLRHMLPVLFDDIPYDKEFVKNCLHNRVEVTIDIDTDEAMVLTYDEESDTWNEVHEYSKEDGSLYTERIKTHTSDKIVHDKIEKPYIGDRYPHIDDQLAEFPYTKFIPHPFFRSRCHNAGRVDGLDLPDNVIDNYITHENCSVFRFLNGQWRFIGHIIDYVDGDFIVTIEPVMANICGEINQIQYSISPTFCSEDYNNCKQNIRFQVC